MFICYFSKSQNIDSGFMLFICFQCHTMKSHCCRMVVMQNKTQLKMHLNVFQIKRCLKIHRGNIYVGTVQECLKHQEIYQINVKLVLPSMHQIVQLISQRAILHSAYNPAKKFLYDKNHTCRLHCMQRSYFPVRASGYF